MEMVAHQNMALDHKARPFARFTQRLNKKFPIHLIMKGRLPPVLPAHHMSARPMIFDSWGSRHPGSLSFTFYPCKILQSVVQNFGMSSALTTSPPNKASETTT